MFSSLFRRKSIDQIHSELRDQRGNEGGGLIKSLGLLDLVAFGIAAIIGAGIFSTIGTAANNGGPAISLLFLLTAVACLFSALCYAEFASMIPVSGSAYTYSYAAFGEVIAWLIGWNLVMEYAIGNSTIAFSWSEYFTSMLGSWGESIPAWLQTDYYSCAEAARNSAGLDPKTLSESMIRLLDCWNQSPNLGGLRLIVDVPAMAINILTTMLVYIGIRESKFVGNLSVLLKTLVVILVIVVGAFYVDPKNWSPFAPNGATGVMQGIAGVFFAYIGFDAISTTSEECKNAQRDIPRATIITLIVCTILYILITFVLTGMVSYKELGVSDPMAFVFEKYDLKWMIGVVSVSAVVAMTSVFLVFQLGQPRIWMSMARDGLLPPAFAKIHPRFKTPGFATIVTGIVVALPILFLNQAIVTDLCSIGTLFAFMLVSAGVIALEEHPDRVKHASFRVPRISGKWVVPIGLMVYSSCLFWLPSSHNFLAGFDQGLAEWLHKLPYLIFHLVFLVMSVLTFQRNWSLIPVLGVLTNLYLIAGIGHINWLRFVIWCAIGFVVYFAYGYWNSRLASSPSRSNT